VGAGDAVVLLADGVGVGDAVLLGVGDAVALEVGVGEELLPTTTVPCMSGWKRQW
jgi:hypothetical protein